MFYFKNQQVLWDMFGKQLIVKHMEGYRWDKLLVSLILHWGIDYSVSKLKEILQF